ncbi:hypothetical protein [Kaistia algarum]|uniref:hypothetical protein n=1 Tax=Kaistia algarum TaxID=2083279 RepID=UPI0010571B89|nr:hypothetical protein [Kaistia algarum]MCX5512353.1 hypothetical protein [Kaistia algarum]
MSLAVPVARPPRDFARTRRRRSLAAAFALILASFAAPAAWAQQAIVGPEDIVATGFSGFADGATPTGADPLDYKIIAPNGPSARIVDVSRLGPQGGLSRVSKPFTVTAAEIGQVFGVALDDAQAPNIYLAATAAYGLSIGVADPSGAVKRLRQGDGGAAYIPGMFGPSAEGGGPGSIWRIDGAGGQATNFANIGDGLPASLGALAFDPKSQQLFVSDRATGLIHRLGLDGKDRGNFDHGVEARPAAGLPDAPLAPISVDITTSDFDTEQPATWGFADPERLVFGLAVQDDRLYYAVAAGPEIWSVGIAADGSFAADARFELAVPALQAGMEVAQIAFDGEGRLYAAERSPPTGAYDFQALATGGDSRVLRFLPKPVPDGNPGFWLPDPETYAIGLAPEHRNADGGIVLGRGYDANGRIALDQCRATLWSTGEKLLGDGASNDPVDGLQGNDPSLVAPANVPPIASWFVDYDDLPGDPLNAGHMGALAVVACQGGVRAEIPPPPPPVIVNCPVGTMLVGGACLLPPRCPPGTRFRDGYCVVVGCPPDMVRVNGACIPPPRICDRYETFVNGRCLPWACPGDLVRMPNGYCGCPPSEIYLRGKCVPPPACPPGMVQTRDGRCLPPPCPEFWQRDRAGRCLPPECRRPFVQDRAGRCVCPPNLVQKGRECLPPPKQCPPGFVAGPKGRCVCPPNLIQKRGVCVPPPVVQPCPENKVRDAKGRCVCPPNLILKRGICVPPPVVQPCPEDKVRDAKGRCVCPPNTIQRKGRCVPPPVVQPCPEGQLRDKRGRCVCPQGLILRNGVCRPPVVIDCSPGFVLKGGTCIPVLRPDLPIRPIPPKCEPGERLVNGRCITVINPGPLCKKGTVPRDGRCVPIRIETPQNDNPEPPVLRQQGIQLMVPGKMMVAPQDPAPQ